MGYEVWEATALVFFGLVCRGRSDRGGGQGDSLYPVGYLDKQVPDTSVQETDRILVEKVQRYKCNHSPWASSELLTYLFFQAAYGYLTEDGPYPEYLVAKLLEISVTLVDRISSKSANWKNKRRLNIRYNKVG